MKILGLIPARSGSKGVPNKNIKNFNGKPLIYYAISEALQSKYITDVVVSTDSQKIADIAVSYGAQVPFIRPSDLAEDHTPDFPVIEHAVKWYERQGVNLDYIVFLRPTNIFRSTADIDKAVDMILGSKYDSVRGVSEVGYSPYWMKKIINQELVSFINSSYSECRRQELPKVYQANGTVDIINIDTILNKKSRYGDVIGAFMMNDISRIDIDTKLDFEIAELLHEKFYNLISRK